MQLIRWDKWRRLPALLTVPLPDRTRLEALIRNVERNVLLPVKAVVAQVLFYYFYFSNWFDDVTRAKRPMVETLPQDVVLARIRSFFLLYVALNAAVAVLLIGMNRLPLKWAQRTACLSSVLDSLFLGSLAFVTGGFNSILYWVFLALIVRNAITHPQARFQLSLNFMVTASFLAAGSLEAIARRIEPSLVDATMRLAIEQGPQENTEPVVLRIFLLILVTACCYAVQILLDRQRRAEEESHEHALRQEQLEATGRLAAEIAHQLKNPLGIINNAAYTLQRTVKEGETIAQQIEIIREEVDKSDRIITELLGYARLSEGHVERLDIAGELDYAVLQVFPVGAKYQTTIHRDYSPALPTMLAQRGHITEIFVNLLQNAREAMDGRGNIWISAHYEEGYTVKVTIRDDGPGVPADKVTRIFEPYFTTKAKGTGLGLSIVKANAELYNGSVEVESTLGVGTLFTVKLPAKTLINFRK